MTNCKLCGEPMPAGEEMFMYHGYSGPCPKPPLAIESMPKLRTATDKEWRMYYEKKCREQRNEIGWWRSMGQRFIDFLDRDEPEDADDDTQEDSLTVFGEEISAKLGYMDGKPIDDVEREAESRRNWKAE